jgi:hypothetical protein
VLASERLGGEEQREVKSSQGASDHWKHVCELSSRLLDSPKSEWDSILDRECGEDGELRAQVLEVCSNYSETDEFFGAPVVSPLTERRRLRR